jgi:glyoxylase-like metal-dependent hydrolase (beta-lactamase superfamily II)
MKPLIYTGGFTATNGYILVTNSAVIVIDAPEGIADFLASNNLSATHLLLTHQHFDHVMDAAALQASGAKTYAFAEYSDELTLQSTVRNWGMPLTVQPYTIDELLDCSQPLVIETITFSLAHVPGHSADSVTFYHADHGDLFSGDTLFEQSIGRPDLPGGNEKLLVSGIKKKLFCLPTDTKVFPGHGDSTSIAAEMKHNPYLQ